MRYLRDGKPVLENRRSFSQVDRRRLRCASALNQLRATCLRTFFSTGIFPAIAWYW